MRPLEIVDVKPIYIKQAAPLILCALFLYVLGMYCQERIDIEYIALNKVSRHCGSGRASMQLSRLESEL